MRIDLKCRLCGNDKLKLYYTQGNIGEYKFYKCNECALVNYDFSTGLDQNKYSGKYVEPEDELHKQNRTQRTSFNFIKKNISKKGKLLDIGCGNGKILLLAKQDGWEVKGLELSDLNANTIKSRYNIPVEVANFMEYDVTKDKKNDLVILRHVLEHLPDSILALNKINQLLNSDGSALLEFPNIESLEFKFKRLLSKIGPKKKYRTRYKPGHCNEFCKESFSYLIKKTGFQLISWELYSNKMAPNYLLTKLNISSKARALIKKVKDQ